ncbi:MAG: glycine--tRNA ligase subunit beta [Nitrospirota bacterium]
MDQATNQKISFLLEIGTEDLPARFLSPALQQLKENAETILTENFIGFSEVKVYGTPRRLTVMATGIPPLQEGRIREIFGPSRKVAFDENGTPTKAAQGFARSQGVSVESLVIRNKNKGEYVVALVEEKGLPVRQILPDILKRIVFSLHLPKSMRWGNNNIKFVRPIRWLMAILDREAVTFEIDGIVSTNMTRGHRFLSPAAFKVKELPSYKKLLANNYVIVDQEERRRIILEKSQKLLTPLGARLVEDEELLQTVVNLVEYPVPVLADFSKTYLNLPKELLITVMRGHQKYFAVEDNEGRVTNKFIVVSNTGEDNSETVRSGAERVIKARFEDARFYFEEDLRKPLPGRIEELKRVVFHERLGSLFDKARRLASIAEFLGDKILPESKDKLLRSALLAKTDLVTGVVREFPELQGIMGKYYALYAGEDREVAEAIEEQYLPSHSGGKLPTSDVGALLSISDKADNIAAFFSLGLTPTGSEDPFALRRQAFGIIAIIMDKNYGIIMRELIQKAVESLLPVNDSRRCLENIFKFLEGRLETVLLDQGFSPDTVNSVLPFSMGRELIEIKKRLEAVQKFKGNEKFNDFLIALKRVHNIIPKEPPAALNIELLMDEAEKNLAGHLESVRRDTEVLLKEGEFYEVLVTLSSLTEPINLFFDHVLVMDKRESLRLNRLALLGEIWRTASAIADLSKLSSVA